MLLVAFDRLESTSCEIKYVYIRGAALLTQLALSFRSLQCTNKKIRVKDIAQRFISYNDSLSPEEERNFFLSLKGPEPLS